MVVPLKKKIPIKSTLFFTNRNFQPRACSDSEFAGLIQNFTQIV